MSTCNASSTQPHLTYRLATLADLPAAHQLYAAAREFMAANGNPTQWAGGYPQDEMLRDDIAAEALYLAYDAGGQLVAVFFFDTMDDDETYRKIDGSWLNEEAYGVVHRIATKQGTRGVGTACIQWALEQARSRGAAGGVRIDTHADNAPMRGLLERKLGFTYTGTIWTYDGTPRVAYQRLV